MTRPLNILYLSTNDYGGAGLAFLKGAEASRKNGNDARVVVWDKRSDSSVSIGVYDHRKRIDKIILFLFHTVSSLYKRMILRIPRTKYIFFDIQQNRVSAKKLLRLYGKKPDIILVGWVSDFVSNKTILQLKTMTGAKVVFIMTDNAPIGGGCHYPWDCQGYASNCYPCPALRCSSHLAQKTLFFKRRYVSSDMIISGTGNDMKRARKSIVFKDCVHVVSSTLEPNPYEYDRSIGREMWTIADNKYVIFCGAASVVDERKGFAQLVESLELLKKKDISLEKIVVLVAGNESLQFPDGYDVRFLGRLSFEDLFKAYCCADLFVCPSLEDSGPMMINYGVMAYIPVVSFDMGVASDIILHKENGYIAKWKDCEDFAEGILYWYQKGFERVVLKSINNNLAEEISETKSLQKYIDKVIVPYLKK